MPGTGIPPKLSFMEEKKKKKKLLVISSKKGVKEKESKQVNFTRFSCSMSQVAQIIIDATWLHI